MKISTKILTIGFVLSLFSHLLIGEESTMAVGWIDSSEVHISNGLFYIHTNLGVVQLTVLDYDEENERYLVECIKYGEFFYPTPLENLESYE